MILNPDAAEPVAPTTKLRRKPDRTIESTSSRYSFLDQSPIGFLGIVQNGYPTVLPMAFVRFADEIHLHGSIANNNLQFGIEQPVCFTTAIIDGLVLAKAAANHSFNYRSTVVFGKLEEISDEEQKSQSMTGLIERYYPGRSQLLRKLSSKELKSIKVARLSLDQMSAKQRSGPPISDLKEPYPNAWVGTIDLNHFLGTTTSESDTEWPIPRVSDLLFGGS